ncbi:MAG: MBL fold metallo-hydrolase [Gemmatimonadaceae bacterium]
MFTWPRSRIIGYSVYAFLVRGVLVDNGFPGAARDARALITHLRPRGAFVTHHHEDHAGNTELLAKSGVPLAMDSQTLTLLQHPDAIGPYRHFMWKATPPVVSSVIPFTDDALSLIHTPGHCSNHHSVWDESTGTLFAGDLFLGVKVRMAHAYENPRQHVQSLRAVIARNPDRMFCAHRGFVANGTSMLRAKADWIEHLVAKTDKLIDDGRTDREIRKELIGSLGSSHFISAGDYSPVNLVAAIRRTRPQP